MYTVRCTTNLHARYTSVHSLWEQKEQEYRSWWFRIFKNPDLQYFLTAFRGFFTGEGKREVGVRGRCPRFLMKQIRQQTPGNEPAFLGTQKGNPFSNILRRNIAPPSPGGFVTTEFHGLIQTLHAVHRPRPNDVHGNSIRPGRFGSQKSGMVPRRLGRIISIGRRQFRRMQSQHDNPPPFLLVHYWQHPRHQMIQGCQFPLRIIQSPGRVQPINRLVMPPAARTGRAQPPDRLI